MAHGLYKGPARDVVAPGRLIIGSSYNHYYLSFVLEQGWRIFLRAGAQLEIIFGEIISRVGT